LIYAGHAGIDARWNLEQLAASYRAGRPFPHVVIDDLVAPDTLGALCQAVAQEPHWANRGEIYDFMASATTVSHPVLREFHTQLGGPAMLEAVRAITGRPVTHCDLRSYVYLAGSYLLPHSDSRAPIRPTGEDPRPAGNAVGVPTPRDRASPIRRLVAYAYYIHTASCEGGELELFECAMDGDELVSARPTVRIAPRDNRMVMFDVTNGSLHQVCEVLSGARVSLTGWFLG
jgi:hypothetical protein